MTSHARFDDDASNIADVTRLAEGYDRTLEVLGRDAW
jgi:hypothetical protein